ncbi:nucleotidyltransferase domain-containing protein [Rhizobium ruizarguesonis]
MISGDNVYFAGVFQMIRECRDIGLNAEWYIFGSACRGDTIPADIDILCLVDTYEVGREISEAVSSHLLRSPIDLRILSREDESRLDFKRRTGSVRLGH